MTTTSTTKKYLNLFEATNLNVRNLPGFILICCSNCVYHVYHLVYPLTCHSCSYSHRAYLYCNNIQTHAKHTLSHTHILTHTHTSIWCKTIYLECKSEKMYNRKWGTHFPMVTDTHTHTQQTNHNVISSNVYANIHNYGFNYLMVWKGVFH